ncbi:MAG: peptidase M15 [Phycisphaerae bacterium]|nr:peptidase M15 [Phycisphaerae bacterium]
MKLSRNLTLKEVVKSNTATRLGIDNNPDDWGIENLRAIAENIFQPIRDHFGVPIGVSSGYRGKDLNKAIGGSKYSQHMTGEALDLDADMYGKITNADIFKFVKNNLHWDQMIWEFGDDEEPNWVHISYKPSGGNRKQIKRAYRDSKGVHYKVV